MTESTKGKPLKILRGERISIPKEFMKELKLKVGDLVLMDSLGNQLRIIPAEVVPR